MYAKLFTVVLALIPPNAGLPLEAPRHNQPCKQVHDEFTRWMLGNGIVRKNLSAAERLFMPPMPAAPIRPSIAFACLKSIPLHQDLALQQVDLLRPLLEWQSSIDYLRNPPRGYLSEPVDLLGGLDGITAKLKARKGCGYDNLFDFMADLYTLTQVRPRDYHIVYATQLMDLFTFPLGVRFVSISEDGITVPKIYLHDDLKHTQNGYSPSPVSTIDGVPSLEFLQKVSVKNGFCHDPDCRFNGLFPSLATDAGLSYSVPSPFALDLRDRTTVKCENGTRFEYSNTAFARGDFTNITSAGELFDAYGPGNGTGEQVLPWASYVLDQRNYTSNSTGYPQPVKTTLGGHLAGFLPEGPELSDVAVISANAFTAAVTPDTLTMTLPMQYQEYYNITIEFLRAAKAANRTKLILDMQGNLGGLLPNVASLYLALFSSISLPLLYLARAHPQFAWVGEQVFNKTTRDAPWPLIYMIKPDLTHWTSFSELYGPYSGPRGQHTHPAQINLTAYSTLFQSPFPFPSSFPYPANPSAPYPPWTEPPFAPEDITIVTDGQCGSACAMTISMLTHAHGIRTVALGGRPLQAPMQAVGQTKGGPAMSFAVMPSDVDRSTLPEGLAFPPSPLPEDGYTPPLKLGGPKNEILGWGTGVGFNVADMIPAGELEDWEDKGEKAVPLQFRYEAANCRLFYTWEMARDITAVWRAVAGVAWRGEKCIPGSTTNADGTMGGVPEYSEAVEDRYGLGKGPGAVR